MESLASDTMSVHMLALFRKPQPMENLMTGKSPRTWLITGADKGLGLSAAMAALDSGARVIVTVLAADGSHRLASEYPDRFKAFHLDARDHQRFPAVVAEAEGVFGGIDVLVNTAGYGLLGVFEEHTPERYRPLFDVHVFGAAEMIRAVLPGMRRRRSGHIINISSSAGVTGNGMFAWYSSAKFAVEGFSEALANELGPLGIRVTIVEPGAFRTDYAGPSLVTEHCKIADYASTLGERIKQYASFRHGSQPNDPVKFGPVLVQVVNSETPPLRLPLGDDALKIVRDKLDRTAAETARWEELSRSTTVPA
jgi:NAD(P)-dependent dehydrogenase (short-subunit alcohol dehydrogenase family)